MTYDDFSAELSKAGLSIRAFAELIGMNPNSVSNYASAGGLQDAIEDSGLFDEHVQVEYGGEEGFLEYPDGEPYTSIDFYKVCSWVSDKFRVEQHGSDKFDVIPVSKGKAKRR